MGAPLTNFRTASRLADEQNRDLVIGKLVIQGGFAGDGLVPEHLQIDKFKGKTAVPSHNLIGDKKATAKILDHQPKMGKYYVSKNVCHRVIYDRAMHQLVAEKRDQSQSLNLIYTGMETYFIINPEGKILHDPLAACCAIDPTIGMWREVEIFKDKNAYGAILADNSNTFIIIDYDQNQFVDILLAV